MHPAVIPSALTLTRLVLALLLFAILALAEAEQSARDWLYTLAPCVFLVAAITDGADGFLARRLKAETVIGGLLDSCADKVLVCGTLLMLAPSAIRQLPPPLDSPWWAALILTRELGLSYLRCYIQGTRGSFQVMTSGKLKMALQCTTLLSLLLLLVRGFPFDLLHSLLLKATTLLVWASLTLTLYTGVAYLCKAFQRLDARVLG